MKKLTTILSVICLSFTFSFAEDVKEVYDYDTTIEEDFAQLNEIEAYVNANDVTLDKLKAENSSLLDGIEISNESSASLLADELPLGIPAFWWGCVLTVLGVVLVYVLTDQDKDQTKKALYGCLVTGVVYIVLALVVGGSSRFFF
ncbi:MAG: hypothetical protein ACI9V1_001062 [Spirosomataceae bacterium]|jgi:hypothetical protein